MTEKTRNRLLLGGLAAVLLAVVLLFTFLGRGEEEFPEPEAPPVENGEGLGTAADLPAVQPIEELLGAFTPPPPVSGPTPSEQMAVLFAERYGSYSNQGQYQNLRDLLPVMTASLRAETEAFLASVENGVAPPDRYEGYTAVKVAARAISLDEASGRATYDVTLQQAKTVGAAVVETRYPVLRVVLQRTGEEWRVASVSWRP